MQPFSIFKRLNICKIEFDMFRKAPLILFFIICKIVNVQSSEFNINDTINFTDAAGKKQGHWIFFNSLLHKPGYTNDQKVEEGKFVDSKKTGIWLVFFPNNKIKSKIPYVNNRQDGYAVAYYENGNIKEEGLWKNNRWVGDYKFYYETGKVQQEFKFNASGKRDGPQKYYDENGQTVIDGNWEAGKADLVKEFYDNGDIKAEKTFDNGTIASIKTFNSTKTISKVDKKVIKVIEPTPPPAVVQEEKDNLGKQFNGEGYWKLFNANKQVSKDGVFSKSKLIEGKVYNYNQDGILIRVAVYKEGKYIGDSVIEE